MNAIQFLKQEHQTAKAAFEKVLQECAAKRGLWRSNPGAGPGEVEALACTSHWPAMRAGRTPISRNGGGSTNLRSTRWKT